MQEIINRSFLSLASKEIPDWGFARNKKATLMVPSAEWVQSIFSCQINLNDKFIIAPNRDSSYEGLLAYNNGENWKFIDFIGISIQDQEGKYLPVFASDTSPCVYLSPWMVTYCYFVSLKSIGIQSQECIPFYVNYYLNSQSPSHLTTGYVEVSYPDGLKFGATTLKPSIHPFFDIRHMYHESRHYAYCTFLEHRADHDRMVLSHYNRTFTLFYKHLHCDYFPNPDLLEWHYKLGIGERFERYSNNTKSNAIHFRSERRTVASYFSLSPHLHNSRENSFRFYFACGLNDEPRKPLFTNLITISNKSIKYDSLQLEKIESFCNNISDTRIREAVIARIAGLLKFKINISVNAHDSVIKAPYAGAWWFKTPWYRDVFEGYLSNFKTFFYFSDEKEAMKKTILFALENQDCSSGLIPNRLNEFQDGSKLSYQSTDSVLLAYIIANKIALAEKDVSFAKQVLEHIIKTISCFTVDVINDSMDIDGIPRIDPGTGLLLSVPWHSWIDTRNNELSIDGMHFTGLPNRVSQQFAIDLFKYLGSEINLGVFLSSPNFYLPEINAQWITVLASTCDVIKLLKDISPEECPSTEFEKKMLSLKKMAVNNYRKVFLNTANNYLFNIVYVSPGKNKRLTDEIESETAITSAAILGAIVFSKGELEGLWKHAKKCMIVKRTLSIFGKQHWPFGVLTHNVNTGAYYGDGEYHADVCWPRSTPYLLNLLDLLGQSETIAQILINNLDHQLSESAVFYNQELFSRPVPENKNPYPDEKTAKNPIPVKNPIQFWSQWCDPYLQYMNTISTMRLS